MGSAAAPFPGPRGWPVVGSLPTVVKHGLLDTTLAAWREYGDVFRVRVGPLWLNFIAHPDGAEHVLKTERRNYIKGSAYDSFRRITGNGLLTAEGEDWRSKRRRIQPAFAPKRIGELAETMAKVTAATVDEWERRLPDDETFDLEAEMARITLRIVGATLFGIDVSDVENHSTAAFAQAMEWATVASSGGFRWPAWLPTPSNRRMKRNLEILDTTVFDIIRRGREQADSDGDQSLLKILIHARDDESGESFGDKELRDEVITMFLAGHETTALTLTWCFHFLSRHPEVLDEVVAEVDREIGDRVPTMEDCGRLTFMRAVLEETLRMRPPAWAVARNAVEDDVIMGHRIPAESIVIPSVYLIHHHPEFWDDPHAFRPQRFLDRKPRHDFDNLPFSRGPRMCIGAGFAMVESQIVLSMLLQRARPEAAAAVDVSPKVRITLHPSAKIPLRWKWRK